jgi:capsular polysaccharide biosynthesis protein
VRLCRQIGLFEHALVAIDGSKFKAATTATRTSRLVSLRPASSNLRRAWNATSLNLTGLIAIPRSCPKSDPSASRRGSLSCGRR